MGLFRITGLKEVQRAFRELPKVAANKVVRQGVRAGAKVVQAKAKQFTPKRSGALAKDIKVRAAPKRKKGVVMVNVLMGSGDYQGRSFYGAFPEYGTKGRRRSADGRRRRQPAQHFLRKAYLASRNGARDEAAKVIRDGIEREAAALGKKG